jgi:PAS domain S-box-containing protein
MGTEIKTYRVTIIDDNPDDTQMYMRFLSRDPHTQYSLTSAELGEEGLEKYRSTHPDCILLDYNLPDMDGIEFIRQLIKSFGSRHAPVVMLTGQGNETVAVEAMKNGACDYLVKSTITKEILCRVVNNAIDRAQAAKDIQRLALGIESAGEAIVMTDVSGNISYINPAFTELTGYSAEEAIGQNPRILSSGEHPKEFYNEMWTAILGGQSWRGQVTNRRKDGTLYDAQLTIAPIGDIQSQIQGFVAVHDNITPLKMIQEALQTSNRELERKNAKLTQLTETAHRFVDNVAHDFRTPLTVIKEFSSIIVDGLGGPVTDEQAEYLQFITTATRDLAQMVDDFLDSSKLKAGVLRVNREPHSVDQIFESVRSILKTRASLKKIQVIEDKQPDLPQVFVDAEKIERVIINLVVNAIKFSNEGSDITLWAQPTGNGEIEIGITDCGPGLSENDLAVIFERFKQVGDIQRASTKGFGLGLNIAKELVWLNLGAVNVQSKQGHGSTFSFTLPTCEPSIILRRYFERFEELSEPPLNMTVLQVKPDEPTGDLEEVRRFLTSVCYPMDLVLKANDIGSVFIFGSTAEPDTWIERLQTVRGVKIKEYPKDHLAPLRIDYVASAPYTQIKDQARSSSLAQIAELRHCA